MSDYDYDGFEDEPPTQGASGPTLPGGISVQAAAAMLLVAVLIATLYLFFGPEPDAAIAPEGGTAVAATSTVVTSATSRAPTMVAGAAPTFPSIATAQANMGTLATAVTLASPTADTDVSQASEANRPPSLVDGGYVEVVGTDGFGMRYRFGPGLDTATIRIVTEGEFLKVSGEPEDISGTRWWRLLDSLGNVGWAIEDYLSPAAAPSLWNPPIASPPFVPSTDSSTP